MNGRLVLLDAGDRRERITTYREEDLFQMAGKLRVNPEL
jgi:hypothetical protein